MHQRCVCPGVCNSSPWTVGGPLSAPPECVDGWLPTRDEDDLWGATQTPSFTANIGTFMMGRCSPAGGRANSHSWSCLFPGLPHARPIYPLGPLKSLQHAASRRAAAAADHLTAVMHSSARLKVTFIIFFPLILSQACDTTNHLWFRGYNGAGSACHPGSEQNLFGTEACGGRGLHVPWTD